MSPVYTSSKLKSKATSRDKHIDTIKFLLIFSIFIFHCESPAGNFYPFVNLYQVSIFFLVSGFWALNRIDKSPLQFICNAFKKYLVYWLFWVIIYTAYYTIANSLSAGNAFELFIRYFSGVRATGIWGMWFTPAFFFVSFVYFLFSKGIAKVFKVQKKALAWICCAFFFVVHYVTEYFYKIPQKLIFSLGFVPEYLFYFSLGAVVYIYISACKPKMKQSVFLRGINCLITLCSFVYFLMYFFKKDTLIWWWLPNVLGGKLSFLSDLVTILLMYSFISCMARCFCCDFTSKIGNNTLGLCHCEAFVKEILMCVGNLIGLSIKVTNPIEVLIFAFVALVFGCYVVLPVTDTITKRILLVGSK